MLNLSTFGKLLTHLNYNVMASVDTLGFGDLQAAFAGNADLTAAQKIRLQYNSIPKMTTTERNALTGDSVFLGLVIFNTTTGKLNVKATAGSGATGWEAVSSS